MVLRLLLAAVLGGIVGMERGSGDRPAGFRTHILVCAGSALIMLVSMYGFDGFDKVPFEYPKNRDSARIAAQVVSGIGFLGAGTILHEGITVRGLTTAASLWAVACLGIAAGGGYYAVALAGMVFIFITLTLFEYIQHKLIKPKQVRDYALQVTDVAAAMEAVHALADKCKGQLSGFRAETMADGYRLFFRVQFSSNKKHPREFFEGLTKEESIRVTAIVEDTMAV